MIFHTPLSRFADSFIFNWFPVENPCLQPVSSQHFVPMLMAAVSWALHRVCEGLGSPHAARP